MNTIDQSKQQDSISQTANNSAKRQSDADKTIPEHTQPHQPTTEAERQQQLQDAHLENQDASVKLPEKHHSGDIEHKEIGDTQ